MNLFELANCVLNEQTDATSDREEQENELQEAFIDFAHEYPQTALSLITGLFVGLLEHEVKKRGEDHTKEIVIDGGEFRGITIHKTNT